MSEKASLRVPDYLGHMLQAIERIRRYVGDEDRAGFLQDEKTQDAVIRNIEIIGEAARNVGRADPAFAAEHSEIPWPVIYAMRNRISHGYFAVDLDLVWQTVQMDLPSMEQQIHDLKRALEQSAGDAERGSDRASET